MLMRQELEGILVDGDNDRRGKNAFLIRGSQEVADRLPVRIGYRTVPSAVTPDTGGGIPADSIVNGHNIPQNLGINSSDVEMQPRIARVLH